MNPRPQPCDPVEEHTGAGGSDERSPEAKPKRKVRWHPVAVHFPMALFGTAFAFQLLHIAFYHSTFQSRAFFLSSNILVLIGAAAMIPAVWTGWIDWKRNYRGAGTRLFKRKILVGFGMLVVSVAVSLFRSLYYGFQGDLPAIHHIWYVLALGLLIAGAVVEGFYGGRLIRR